IGFVMVGFALWGWARRPQSATPRLLVSLILAASLCAGLALGFAEALKAQPAPAHGSTPQNPNSLWQEFSQQRLDALLQGDDPIFVDMTAAWCITCKVNERIALNIPQTQALFAARKVTALQGDWTNQNPEITKFLESHGRKGVPLYVYYGPRGADGQRPAPVILPQLLTPALVASALE
ncbi:MAG TPA: thioredoxin family protein, partial [Micavibrio sp.]